MGSYDGFGDVDTFKLGNAKFNDGTNLKDAESDAFKRACMRFGLGVELWSGSKQSEEEATAVAPDGYTQEMADKDAMVEVTKVDMRRKENKPSKEDIKRMNDIMDSIIGEDNGDTVRNIIDTPETSDEAPF
jgi:hypothetical protein